MGSGPYSHESTHLNLDQNHLYADHHLTSKGSHTHTYREQTIDIDNMDMRLRDKAGESIIYGSCPSFSLNEIIKNGTSILFSVD